MSNQATSYVRSRVNGGVISDQMLKGRLRFFKMEGTGVFANTISDGTVIIPNLPTYGGTNTVGDGKPVPKSAAEVCFQVLLEKCTVSLIKVIDDDTIHYSVENTDNAWNTTNEGPFNPVSGLDTDSDSAANMEAAINAVGVITVPDDTDDGTTVDLNDVSITEVRFELA